MSMRICLVKRFNSAVAPLQSQLGLFPCISQVVEAGVWYLGIPRPALIQVPGLLLPWEQGDIGSMIEDVQCLCFPKPRLDGFCFPDHNFCLYMKQTTRDTKRFPFLKTLGGFAWIFKVGGFFPFPLENATPGFVAVCSPCSSCWEEMEKLIVDEMWI